jgi:hypothetical protein
MLMGVCARDVRSPPFHPPPPAGSHQLTAAAVGTMGRYGAKPVIIVLNNEVRRVEEGWRHP